MTIARAWFVLNPAIYVSSHNIYYVKSQKQEANQTTYKYYVAAIQHFTAIYSLIYPNIIPSPAPCGALLFVTTMLKRLNPRTNFDCDAMELAKLMFSADDNKSAKELGVNVDEWMQWKTGAVPVPKAIWLCLKQQKQLEDMKPLRGFSLDGNRLNSPWGPLLTDEILRLPEYRRAANLAEKQAELIERLMMERDFYRDNLARQARFGLMVNNIFRDES